MCHGIYLSLKSKVFKDFFEDEEEEQFAVLLAGLCHDTDHTGKTNAFEVSSFSSLAIKYNDDAVFLLKKVLENHHAAVTFKILNDENCNFLSNLADSDFRLIRKMFIQFFC